MTRTIAILAVLALGACTNTNHPVGAPSGIRAESGGGVQQLSRVPGVNPTAAPAGVISTTRVQ